MRVAIREHSGGGFERSHEGPLVAVLSRETIEEFLRIIGRKPHHITDQGMGRGLAGAGVKFLGTLIAQAN
jgi:hypothetical protein